MVRPGKRPKKQSKDAPMTLIGVGILFILLAIVVAVIFTQQRVATTTNSGDIPYPNVARIALKDAQNAFEASSAVFLDVRDSESFAISHVPGALNIPVGELESRLSELPKGQQIITYCT